VILNKHATFQGDRTTDGAITVINLIKTSYFNGKSPGFANNAFLIIDLDGGRLAKYFFLMRFNTYSA